MAEQLDDFLTHDGVKGMKWGKRKGKYTESRKDYKSRVKSEQSNHDREHLSKVLTTSLKKGEDVLVRTQLPYDHIQTIMTGKQFVEMAGRGSALNARATDIFATLDKKQNQFVLNETPTPTYTPSERR
jgi:hypothetical protein